MAAKEILFHDEARAKIVAGVNVLANAVRGTLGPKARTVMLERSWGAPIVINSGVVVAKEIELKDRFENMGVQMAREVEQIIRNDLAQNIAYYTDVAFVDPTAAAVAKRE